MILPEGVSTGFLKPVLDDLGVAALVFDDVLAGTAAELAQHVPLAFSHGSTSVGNDLLALAQSQSPAAVSVSAREDDIAIVAMSSGSTGTPKGIAHTFANAAAFLRMDEWLHDFAPRRFLFTHSDRRMVREVAIWTFAAGGMVILQDDSSPSAVFSVIRKENVTHVFDVPQALAELIRQYPRTAVDCASLRQVEFGGTPASPEIVHELVAHFGSKAIQTYGQWETGFITVLQAGKAGPDKYDSVGLPFPGVDISVRDAEGHVVSSDEPGEVWVRSPATMAGYFNRPDETALVLQNGWARTGDVGRVDGEGFLRLGDRIRDRIIVGGQNVSVKAIEKELAQHPGVRQAAVFAVPDQRTGEAIYAAVACAEGVTVGEGELRAWVNDRLGPLYAPKIVELYATLPLTHKGDPNKGALRAAALGADRPGADLLSERNGISDREDQAIPGTAFAR